MAYSAARKRPGNDPGLTPHPSTWFNQERWTEDRTQWGRLDNERDRGAKTSDFQNSRLDSSALTKCLMVLAHGLNQRMPPEQIQVYATILVDIPVDAVEAAVIRHLSTSSSAFLPPPGVIRAMAIEWSEGKILDSSEAWEKAREAVARFGYMRGKEADEWLPEPVADAVRRIGFQVLCDMEPDSHAATRARFLECYKQVADRMTTDRACPQQALPGAGIGKYLDANSVLKGIGDAGQDCGEVR